MCADWQKRFGAARRAIDRKLLAEVERALSFTCPDCGKESFNVNDVVNRYCGKCHVFTEDKRAWEEHERIARAFGRPVK
jgi:ribosomal protein S27AE